MGLTKNRQRGYINVSLSKQLGKIYEYDKSGSTQSNSNYLAFIRKDDHKPRELQRFMRTLIDIAFNLNSLSMYQCNFKIVAKIFRGRSQIDEVDVAIMRDAVTPRDFDAIYSELERIYSGKYKEIKTIQNLCKKLGNTPVSYDTIIDKSRSLNISKRDIDSLYNDTLEILEVEDIRNRLISKLDYTQGQILETLALGRIVFHIEYKEIKK